jgi:hypothetical protein
MSSEQTRAAARHACDACGGTGVLWCGRPHRGGRCLADVRCPVCLGAGRISDRMPVADAIADAETLRLYYYHGNFDRCPVVDRLMRRRQIHTRHDRPGSFNACSECDPGSPTLAESLKALNRRRAVPRLKGE